MKIKQKNDEGEEIEVEVSTQEEVDAKLAAEKSALEASHNEKLQEKESAFSALANEKKELETKLQKMEVEGMKEDHPNFKVLKEALAKKDTEIQSIKTAMDDDKKQRQTEAIESKIKIIAKGDTELEKKIKLHLTNTLVGMKESNEEERNAKLQAAYKLSVDHSSDGPGMFDMGTGGGGQGDDYKNNENGNEFSAKEKALGAKLGITAEDYKKYGGRVSKKN